METEAETETVREGELVVDHVARIDRIVLLAHVAFDDRAAV
jgi:hypothetical protein